MAEIEIVRSNERVRTGSRSLMQVGTALLSAAVVKLYFADSFSLEVVGWMLAASLLIYAALKVLDLLDQEG